MTKAVIRVVAAVIEHDGRYLITQRNATAVLPLLWEFPGGKVEPDEDPKHAVARELREELGIDVEVGDILEVTFHRYPEKSVLLLFYEATLHPLSPEPRPIDVADLVWAGPSELRDEAFPPADVAVLAKVRARLG